MEYCLSQVVQPISIQNLAARIGLDRFYLSRLFKKEVGIPLKEYIWKTKEDEAMRLLDQTDLPIQVIARSVGFEAPALFPDFHKESRLFAFPIPEKSAQGKRAARSSLNLAKFCCFPVWAGSKPKEKRGSTHGKKPAGIAQIRNLPVEGNMEDEEKKQSRLQG